MLKFVSFLLPVYLIVFVSMYVYSRCEVPTVWGIEWSGTHDESLCDASIGISIENPNAEMKTFVCSGSVDHYDDANSNLPEGGYYIMEVKAIYAIQVTNIPFSRVASDSDAAMYIGGCSESVAAKIHYDPDLEQFFHGKGEVDIWGSRKTYDSEYFDSFIYDHDEDIFDPLNMI